VNRLSLDRLRQPINPVTLLYENHAPKHAPKITDTLITMTRLCRSSQVSAALSANYQEQQIGHYVAHGTPSEPGGELPTSCPLQRAPCYAWQKTRVKETRDAVHVLPRRRNGRSSENSVNAKFAEFIF
jgi:hypothetical protein